METGKRKRGVRKPHRVPKNSVVSEAGSEKHERGWKPDEELVERVAEAMGRRWLKSDLVTMICRTAGKQLNRKGPSGDYYYPVPMDTVQDVMTAARKSLVERFNLDRGVLKGTAIEFYESVIRNPEAAMGEKLRAQERIDAILGHDAKFTNTNDNAEGVAALIRSFLTAADGVTVVAGIQANGKEERHAAIPATSGND